MADVRLVYQAAFYHPPPDYPLYTAKTKKAKQCQPPAVFNTPCKKKPYEWQGKLKPNKSSQHPVRILEIKYALELNKGHTLVNFLKLWIRLIELENCTPSTLGQRRQHAHQRLPLHHGQTRMGQTCGPSQHHHHCYRHRDEQQPTGNQRSGPRGPFLVNRKNRKYFHYLSINRELFPTSII